MDNHVRSAGAVAERILGLRSDIDTTPMHVIKLVYLCHGWMLGIHDRRLIWEPAQAWRFGPVVPSVYHLYKSFGGDPIETASIDGADAFDPEQNKLMEEVVRAYGDYTAWDLSAITHEEGTPWYRVYDQGRGRGAKIPDAMIREHYRARARRG